MHQRFSLISLSSGLLVFTMLVASPSLRALQPTQQPTQATALPTVSARRTPGKPSVDLAITNLRYSLPSPARAQGTIIYITFKNVGTTPSGPFKWAWFAQPPETNTPPTLAGTLPNLDPGVMIYVRGTYYFGLWGSYQTSAWVNFDASVPETNFLNNVMMQVVATSHDPMVVDFTRLPSGDILVSSLSITGHEFSAWVRAGSD